MSEFLCVYYKGKPADCWNHEVNFDGSDCSCFDDTKSVIDFIKKWSDYLLNKGVKESHRFSIKRECIN